MTGESAGDHVHEARLADAGTRIRQAFFRTYSRLRQWHGTSHNQAEEGITEVRTRTGRRRLIPSTASDWERFTAIVNTPVQGGTADGMKHALVLIHQRLPKSARIVSTVHDEVVVECREESAAECREIITTAMVEAMAALFTKNVGARVYLPSEDEWYKAAYYDPTPGAGGGDNYWLYASQSDTVPTVPAASATGDITNPGANVANYFSGADWNGQNGNVTTVGSAGALAESYFGTADMNGNVQEWNDAVINTHPRLSTIRMPLRKPGK